MIKQFFKLSIIALVISLTSCEKDDPVIEKPISPKEAAEKYLGKQQELSNIRNIVNVLQLDGEAVEIFKEGNLSDTNNLLVNYKQYYIDYAQTKATITHRVEGTKILITVDYGEDGIIEYGEKISGKLNIQVEQNNLEVIEKREWDLTISEDKVNGEMTRTIKRSGNQIIAKVITKDFKIVSADGVTTTENANYKEIISRTKHEILEGKYEVESLGGFKYKYDITKPLLYDFSWTNGYMVPIKGIERVTFSEGKEVITMILDYGDGSKDFLVKVTLPNGESVVVDYNKK